MREFAFSETLLQAGRWVHGALRTIVATGVLTAALLVSAVGAQTALGKAPSAGDRPPARAKIRVLLTHGGHGFHAEAFAAMFRSFPDVEYDAVDLRRSAGMLKRGLEKKYDVLMMFDMIGDGKTLGLTAKQKDAFQKSHIAWVRTYSKSRVFYFMLGHYDHVFANVNCREILSRAIRWTAGRPVKPVLPARDADPSAGSLGSRLRSGAMGFDKLLVIHRHWIPATHVYTYHCEGFRAGGGLYEYDLATGQMREIVASPRGQILNYDLSFDAQEIVFSWRRDEAGRQGRQPGTDRRLVASCRSVAIGEHCQENELSRVCSTGGYQVFTVDLDGRNLEQLTRGPHHNYDACWLPDGGIAFLSTRSGRFAYCYRTAAGVLHRMDADGSNVQCLSANVVNDFTPSVLPDGRIVYGRWEYVDKGPIQSLWTIRPDGTGLEQFYGNRVLNPATFIEPHAVPETGAVICTLTGHGRPPKGAIGLVDPRKGINARESIRNLTPELKINWGRYESHPFPKAREQKRLYENPYPLDRQYYLVSRHGTVLLCDFAAKEQAVVLELDGGNPEALGYFCPRPLRPRPRPPVVASLETVSAGVDRAANENLPVAELAKSFGDRPKVLATSATVGMNSSAEAAVYVGDVYQGLLPHMKRGQIKRIAVVVEMAKPVRSPEKDAPHGLSLEPFQYPCISCGAAWAAKKVLGFADVEADGSAYFRVPAGEPIYFMALDAEGRALQRMRSYTHLMPGEVRGCVGCHEPRHAAAAPIRPPALTASPSPLTPPEWGVRGFDYASIVQPVLDRHCTECHGGASPANGIDLAGDKTCVFNVSYETLALADYAPYEKVVLVSFADNRRIKRPNGDRRLVNWVPGNNRGENFLNVAPMAWGSYRSRLADMLLAGHPDEQGKPRVKLTPTERQRIFMWIDLNVPYYGTGETAYPNHLGARQIDPPAQLDKLLAEIGRRRCANCHRDRRGKLVLPAYRSLRITEPQLNAFLVAPLAKEAGGSGACGTAVFQDTEDPDYQAILKTFEPIAQMLNARPRMDMPGARSAPEAGRSCLLGGFE